MQSLLFSRGFRLLVPLLLIITLVSDGQQLQPGATRQPAALIPVTSETLNGITIGVAPLYVDYHRVVLVLQVEAPARRYSYTLEFPASEGKLANGPMLSVSGIGLPQLTDYISYLPYKDLSASDGDPISGSVALALDASKLSALMGPMHEVPITLSVPLYVNTRPFTEPPPPPTRSAAPTETPTQVPPNPYTLSFVFSFVTPFDTRHLIIPVGDTVESNNDWMTLTSLDITASEARMTVDYDMPKYDPTSEGRLAAGMLYPDTVDKASGTGLIGTPDTMDSGSCTLSATNVQCVFSYSGPSLLDTALKSYSLNVTAYDPSFASSMGGSPLSYGEWVFHFNLPRK